MAFFTGKKQDTTLPPEQAEALLHNIMGDLGIKPAAPQKGRRHYLRGALRFLLPRLLVVLAVAAVFVGLIQEVRILEGGITIQNLAGEALMEDTRQVARVAFSVEGNLFAKPTITAQLGDEMLPVQEDENGFHVDCVRDGTLLITVRAWNGARAVKSVRISGLGQ